MNPINAQSSQLGKRDYEPPFTRGEKRRRVEVVRISFESFHILQSVVNSLPDREAFHLVSRLSQVSKKMNELCQYVKNSLLKHRLFPLSRVPNIGTLDQAIQYVADQRLQAASLTRFSATPEFVYTAAHAQQLSQVRKLELQDIRPGNALLRNPPPQLQTLIISVLVNTHPEIADFQNLPPTIEELEFNGYWGNSDPLFRYFQEYYTQNPASKTPFPKLRSLRIHTPNDNIHFEDLKYLPDNLEELILNCSNYGTDPVSEFRFLPRGLQRFRYCVLKSIFSHQPTFDTTDCPPNLQELELRINGYTPRTFLHHLPASLRALTLISPHDKYHSPFYENMFSGVLPNLQKLVIQGHNLRSFPTDCLHDLPVNLEELEFRSNSDHPHEYSVRAPRNLFTGLNAGLTRLTVRVPGFSFGESFVENLPSGLEVLDLTGCTYFLKNRDKREAFTRLSPNLKKIILTGVNGVTPQILDRIRSKEIEVVYN